VGDARGDGGEGRSEEDAGALKRLIDEMMPANDATSPIDRTVFGGKHELPGPLVTGAGIFVRKRVR
jgi:hypothetical protein